MACRGSAGDIRIVNTKPMETATSHNTCCDHSNTMTAAHGYDLPDPQASDSERAATTGSQYYIIEVQESPPKLILRDFDSREELLSFDEQTSDELMELANEEDSTQPERMAESLHLMATSLASGAISTGAAATEKPDEAPAKQPTRNGLSKKTRKKLWDLPANLHCPIIGTCLDAQELRKLARKARCEQDRPLTDYEVHVSFVASADERNPLSIATQKALEKKYSSHIKRYAKVRTSEALTDHWAQALANGDVPGAFWAILTHPKCDTGLRNRAREEVHMLSHQIGAGQRADLKRLAIVESELKKARHDFDVLYKDTRKQLEERDRRVLVLEAELTRSQQDQTRLAAREKQLLQRLEDLIQTGSEKRVAKLQRQVEVLHRQRGQAIKDRQHWRQACEAASYRAETLEADFRTKCEECEILENLIGQSVSNCQDCKADDCTDCPDLQGQKILCVGGRNQLINQYRALVDQYNGKFEHHDGGIEHSRQRLESMLSAADAIVCATDCVSHDAYYRLKKFCKRHEKPYVLMKSSGISKFAQALDSVVN